MPSSRPPGGRAPEHRGDDLKRISGIGPVVSKALSGAGIRTYRELAGSTPEALAATLHEIPGCSAARIAEMDWIGQALHLADAPPSSATPGRSRERPASEPASDSPALLHVSRLTSALPTSADSPATPDEPTLVGLELRPDPAATDAPTLDYAVAITARMVDGDREFPVAHLRGAARVGLSLSLATAGPPLEPGRYRLVAAVEAFTAGHAPGDPPLWSQTASGDRIEVAKRKRT